MMNMLPANLEKLSNDQLSKYMQYENVLLFKGERAWANHQSFPTLITIVSIPDYFSHDDNDEKTLRLWRCCTSHCCSSTPPSTPRSPDAVNYEYGRDCGDDVEHLPSPPSYRHQ